MGKGHTIEEQRGGEKHNREPFGLALELQENHSAMTE